MKSILSIISILSLPVLGLSQNSADALRYSELGLGGSARFVSMSGSFGALGADISSLHYNPAGLGLFRKSQFTFSPTYIQTDANTTFLKKTTNESRIGFKINNLGMAIAIPQGKGSDWSFVNIGISYSLLADFNSDARLKASNSNSSLANSFAEDAAGTYAGFVAEDYPFSSGLAYQTYLIDPANIDSTEYQAKTFNKDVKTTRRLKEKGHIGETAMSVAANYQQKLFLGATIGVTRVRYSSAVIHTEELVDEADELKEFTYREDLTVTGSGINLKLGAIYQVADWIRFGLSWHSPTNISLNDSYATSIKTEFNTAQFENKKSFEKKSGENSFDYRIVTPAKFMYSVALIAGNKGAINIDYELVNYANVQLRPSYVIEGDEYEFEAENDEIKKVLIRSNRLKIGGEYRVGPWALRGGLSQATTPYRAGYVDHQDKTKGFSLGAGYSNENWFVDFAYSKLTTKRDYYPYSYTGFQEGAYITRDFAQVAFTVGAKF
jgi:long-subunit fatty acid transport protein